MKDALIVSTARTPITLMGHAIRHAVKRAAIDGAEVDDVVIGSVLRRRDFDRPSIRHDGRTFGRACADRG